jgi:hypothetical protein
LRRSHHVLAALLLVLSIPVSALAASDGQLAETLLAAVPGVQEIKKASGHGGWWSEPPEFLGRLDPATGLRTLILQSYRLPEQGTRERIMMAVSAYVSVEAAHARFNDMEPQDNRNFGPMQNLSPGSHGQARLHSSPRPRGQTLRAQEGRYILRLTHWTDGQPMTVAQMTQLTEIAFERLRELDQEKRPLPAQPPLAGHLPHDTLHLGKPLGTAAGPLEWAAFDRAEGENIPDPELRDILVHHMRPFIATLRRWPLTTVASGQVVDALLFRLDDVKAAKLYLEQDRNNRLPERLRPSPLGKTPSHLEKPSGERGSRTSLVFAQGKTVAQLSCGAPYYFAAAECEPALLDLAAAIIASLKE